MDYSPFCPMSGYMSNCRPCIQYHHCMDLQDNPKLLPDLDTTYTSLTKLHFQPYKFRIGDEAIPEHAIKDLSGFSRPKAEHRPTSLEAAESIRNYRNLYGPVDPQNVHRIHSKPYNLLAARRYMSTDALILKEAPIEARQGIESGFTKWIHEEPITHRPYHPMYGWPGFLAREMSAPSVTHDNYRVHQLLDGREQMEHVSERAMTGSGYRCNLREFKPPFREEVLNGPIDCPSSSYLTTYQNVHHRQQIPPLLHPAEADISRTEESGYSHNLIGNKCVPDNREFLSYTHKCFQDPTPKGSSRVGHLWGRVNPIISDGYSTNNKPFDLPEIRPHLFYGDRTAEGSREPQITRSPTWGMTSHSLERYVRPQ